MPIIRITCRYLRKFCFLAVLICCLCQVFYGISMQNTQSVLPAYSKVSVLFNRTSAKVPWKLKREERYNWSYDGPLNQKYKQFAPALNETEYNWYIELISVFKTNCEALNITYLLEGGSVLGAYRYHGFVPWDDDFDVKVNSTQKQTLVKALSFIPRHTLLTPKQQQWKFFNNNNNNSVRTPYKWNWPFIDIFFFAQNKTHIFDVTMKSPRNFDPIADILPLRLEIFENMMLPVPRAMEAYLSKKYQLQNPCLSNWWDHRREEYPIRDSIRIPCKILFWVYPVVHRFKVNTDDGSMYEELRLGNKTLYRIQAYN